MGKEFGMARKGEAGRVQDGFIDWGCYHRCGDAFHGHFDRQFDGVDDGGRIGAIGFAMLVFGRKRLSGDQRRAIFNSTVVKYGGIPYQAKRIASHLAVEMPEGGDGNFRPDAGRLAHGDVNGICDALSG